MGKTATSGIAGGYFKKNQKCRRVRTLYLENDYPKFQSQYHFFKQFLSADHDSPLLSMPSLRP